MAFFIGFHVIRFIYHLINPKAKIEFLRKKTEKQIKADFPRYEKECRKKYEQQAEDKFSIIQLKKEVEKLVSKIESEASSIFKKDIINICLTITKISLEIKIKQDFLDFFVVNYKKVLDDLYNQKKLFFLEKDEFFNIQIILPNELSEAFEQKDDAYDTLNDCKDNIDSWYAESDRTPWLFGNGGKKLPSHSLFGQSFGDLDSYKYDRDEAYSNVEYYKEEIDVIKNKISLNKKNIDIVKQEIVNINFDIQNYKDKRTKMYELIKSGVSKASLLNEINKLQLTLKSEQHNLSNKESAKKYFIIKRKNEDGVIDLECKIKIVLTEKDEFIKEFYSDKNNLNRVNEHRVNWFSNN